MKSVQTAKSIGQILKVDGFGTTAQVSLYTKNSLGLWKRDFAARGYLGSGGMYKAAEGDNKTPVGTFTMGRIFGIRSNPGTGLPYTKVDHTHYWVGDCESAYYNRLVSTRDTVDFDKDRSEHITAYGSAYHYCVDTGYNPKGIPYRGSAVFIHCSTKKPTSGCIAIPERYMIILIRHLKKDAKVMIAPGHDLFFA